MTEDDVAVLDKPVPCALRNPAGEQCRVNAYGPPGDPRCPDHGGPDIYECEVCRRPITDDAERFGCTRYSGPVHVGCHPADCRSVECREALSDPTDSLDK